MLTIFRYEVNLYLFINLFTFFGGVGVGWGGGGVYQIRIINVAGVKPWGLAVRFLVKIIIQALQNTIGPMSHTYIAHVASC